PAIWAGPMNAVEKGNVAAATYPCGTSVVETPVTVARFAGLRVGISRRTPTPTAETKYASKAEPPPTVTATFATRISLMVMKPGTGEFMTQRCGRIVTSGLLLREIAVAVPTTTF